MDGALLTNYEKERQTRIEENKKFLETLQIHEVVADLETCCRKKIRPQRRRECGIKKTKCDVRRSRRLKGKPPVYNERLLAGACLPKRETRKARIRDLTKDEVYTEEHVGLLGSYKAAWELSVDGCDMNGERIYDPVKGKTCHQCRQKTIGKHTVCSKCKKLRGCYCGDCLFMRYGENVDEALGNQKWICPVCRDICNCSFCRIAKGWAPTGTMYRKAISEGYLSVAHYLILTRIQDKENITPEATKEKKTGVLTRSKCALNGH